MKLYKKIILSVVIGSLLTGLSFYVFLPALNIHSYEFWVFLIFVVLFYSLPFLLAKKPLNKDVFTQGKGDGAGKRSGGIFRDIFGFNDHAHAKKSHGAVLLNIKALCITLIAAAVPLAVIIAGSVVSSKLFNAVRYASVIDVTQGVFEQDMKETDEVTNIALMDGESARIIGNRTLGSLSDVVSQYEISGYYTQINYKNTPKKVANLEYAGFFKWLSNRKNGVPGYVMVDPVNNSAEYIKLNKSLRYVGSAYFNDNLIRKLRFMYPTKIFDNICYEVDEDGNPYYIVSCLDAEVMLFGAMDVNEVIIFDPCTGDAELFDVEDVPAWVDIVYSGDLAVTKYNWKGMLSGGFWNSIIGQKDCRITTDDYGYIVIGDDVWYYTGVTSITSDESNIGFILTNARTGEYRYYPVVGAEEYSAMKSAEGEVQEKSYVASFPSLINVSGKATYIMVLKDSGGLVRLYALVNVENYGIVATGSTQAEAMSEYKRLLAANGIISGETDDTGYTEHRITVLSVRDIVIDGNSFVYIEGDDGVFYKGSIASQEELVFVKEGDVLSVLCPSDHDERMIRDISEFEFI